VARTDTDLLVPYAEEAEQSVLGGLIMSQGTAFPIVASILSAADFFFENHQIIFETIERLYNKQADIDKLTVLFELTSINKAGEVGGSNYLTTLITMSIGVSTEETIVYHARIVRETSILRRLSSMAGQVQGKVAAGKHTEEVIEFIHDYLNKFAEESRVLVIDSLDIIKSDPPIYRSKVWGRAIDFTLDEITDWKNMRKRIVSVCDKVPTKHKDHDQFIHNALTQASKIEAPIDTSAGAKINESIERFFDRNTESDDHADLMAGSYMVKPINNIEYLLFFPRPLKRWLKQDLEKAYDESSIWAFITNHGGLTRSVRIKKGKSSTSAVLWGLPKAVVLPPENIPEDF